MYKITQTKYKTSVNAWIWSIYLINYAGNVLIFIAIILDADNRLFSKKSNQIYG